MRRSITSPIGYRDPATAGAGRVSPGKTAIAKTVAAASAELILRTRCRRLCDLMSHKALAYLFFAIEPLKVQRVDKGQRPGKGVRNGRFCARAGRLRARPSGLGRSDRAGAGVRRIACL